MPYLDNDSLLTLIDSADAQGTVHLRPVESKRRDQATVREHILQALYFQSLATLRLERVKKAITELDVTAVAGADGLAISFNLAKLFLLPGISPSAELAELRGLLAETAAAISATPERYSTIQICNERDKNGRVYGSLNYSTREINQKPVTDEAMTASLNARIAASPALTHWLRHVALELQRIGPWSWLNLSEDALFGMLDKPHFQYLRANPDKIKPANGTVQL